MTELSPVTGLDEEQLLTVLTALKNGDLTERMPNGASGTAGQIADTLNTLMDQLTAYTAETNRITREIGIEGRFGGQAEVSNLSGSWHDLMVGLNLMSQNLTLQVRDFAGTTTAVANGDLTKKITVEAQGEILEWKTTVNIMIEQLNWFAYALTCVVRGISADSRSAPQMEGNGAAGTWKDLITNVNLMAVHLATQIPERAEG